MFDTTANGKRFSLTMGLALALVVAAAHFASPLAAQPPPTTPVCFECGPGCNNGRMCIQARAGKYGGKVCTNSGGPEYAEDVCHCWPTGGVCQGTGPQGGESAQAEALDAVEDGRMLRTDGLFYVATRGDQLIVRRKCDGKAIGRVLIAEDGGRSAIPAVG